MIRNMPLERQLELLARCGVRPNPGVGLPELLARHSETQYEHSPFKLLLRVLGSTTETQPQSWLSDNIWLLDIECIAGPGDYVHVARRMAMLAGEALPIEEIQDGIDPLRSSAWLSFQLAGREIKWYANVEESWIDPGIMSNFASLLEAQATDKGFIYLDLPGKECLIGCASPEQFFALRKWSGLDFEWLG